MSTPTSPTSTLSREEISAIDRQLAVRIGLLLRTSILVSSFFILLGIVLWAVDDNRTSSVDEALGKNVDSVHVSPSTIYHGILDGTSTAYIQLGLLLLLLTPTLRVIITGGVFYREKLWLLLGASFIVLFVLILGLFGLAE
jgi:uncharacterized membrane protein